MKLNVNFVKHRDELWSKLLRTAPQIKHRPCRNQVRIKPESTQKINRDIQNLIEILGSFGFSISKNDTVLLLASENGNFSINLMDGSVIYKPLICLKCDKRNECKYSERKLCIIPLSEGWTNSNLSKNDILILSKIFAIYDNILPTQIRNQIKRESDCLNKKSKIMTLEDNLIQEYMRTYYTIQNSKSSIFYAPPIQGPNTPPQIKSSLRFSSNSEQINFPFKLRTTMINELKRLQDFIEFSRKNQ
ncbi:MAG TPA: hypothetical protein VMV49_17570 [Candidatus Deferrimicrobium sp.]|nr:hypothetical protein [Candidatus Deferrimicrobium sp.]